MRVHVPEAGEQCASRGIDVLGTFWDRQRTVGTDGDDTLLREDDGGAGTHRHVLGVEQVGVFDHDRTGRRAPQRSCLPGATSRLLCVLFDAQGRKRVLPAFAHERRKAVERREQLAILVEPETGGLESQAADRIQADQARSIAVADLQLRQLLQTRLALRQQWQLPAGGVAQRAGEQADFLGRSGLTHIERRGCNGLCTLFDLVRPRGSAARQRKALRHRTLVIVVAVRRDGDGNAVCIEPDLRRECRATSTIIECEVDETSAVRLQADRLVTRAIAHHVERILAARLRAGQAGNGLRRRNRRPLCDGWIRRKCRASHSQRGCDECDGASTPCVRHPTSGPQVHRVRGQKRAHRSGVTRNLPESRAGVRPAARRSRSSAQRRAGQAADRAVRSPARPSAQSGFPPLNLPLS
ncbi:MAG: hypothetical protein NTU56_06250 [Proteobacteria bacterium]|nr:hypothetical protein [Pseudomonadota bacterium]